MLGEWLRDPWGVEGLPGECVRGMGLLQTETVFAVQKMRRQIRGSMSGESRMFGEGRGESFSGYEVCGYEIHMGDTIKTGEGTFVSAGEPSGRTVIRLEDGRCGGMERWDGQVFGSYLHGLFDNEELTGRLVQNLARKKGIPLGQKKAEDVFSYKERQYDKLADLVRRSLDMGRIYEILEESGN